MMVRRGVDMSLRIRHWLKPVPGEDAWLSLVNCNDCPDSFHYVSTEDQVS
jgi:hypothetical protein